MRMPSLATAGLLAAAVAASTLLGASEAGAATANHTMKLLFDGDGESLNGVTYHSFRIPSLIRTKANTLIAFAEGRAASNRDYGNINLVFKRSTDNGKNWSALDEVVGRTQATWGNPTAVVDRQTGTIWLFLSWNPEGASQGEVDGWTPITRWDQRRVFLTSSTDDGVTWADPADLSEQLKPKEHADGSVWDWDAVGPGVGIQTTDGTLVIPAQNRNLISRDHGVTWTQVPVNDAATGTPQEGTGEATVLQLADGRLYRNDRAAAYWKDNVEATKRRWVTRGTLDGAFDTFRADNGLPDPRSEGSVMRYNTDAPSRIIFLNSASTSTRTAMRVRVSTNEAVSWGCSRALADVPLPAPGTPGWAGLGSGVVKEGGYSSIARTNDYHIGALVEVNENARDSTTSLTSHRSIVFRKFNLPWLLAGTGTCV